MDLPFDAADVAAVVISFVAACGLVAGVGVLRYFHRRKVERQSRSRRIYVLCERHNAKADPRAVTIGKGAGHD